MTTATRIDSCVDFQFARQNGYHWTTISPGLEIVRIPARNDEEPEFALLKMSNEWYLELKQNPKEFFERHEIFERRLNGVDFVEMPKEVESVVEGNWFVWPIHQKTCRVQMMAYWSDPQAWNNH